MKFDLFEIDTIVSNWNFDRKLRKLWEVRNEQNIRVLLNTLEVPYLVFQQEVFMRTDPKDELWQRLTRIGFETKLNDIGKDPFFEFCQTVLWHKEHNNVIRLVDAETFKCLKTALDIIKALQATDDRLTLQDVMVASLKTLKSEK